jgi:hypothetical protein
MKSSRNGRFLLTLGLFALLTLVFYQSNAIAIPFVSPAITEIPHPPPIPGEDWIDNDSTSHNHNTYIQWNMENIRKQSPMLYDAMASWYIPQGSNIMSYHFTDTSSGLDHADAVHFGHGFIPSYRPVLYQYSDAFLNDAPFAALADINATFLEWSTGINTDSRPFRKPSTFVGFQWLRAPLGEASDIDIWWNYDPPNQWLTLGDIYQDINTNNRYDVGIDIITVDNDGDGRLDSPQNPAWVEKATNPTMRFFGGYWVDDIYTPIDWFFGGMGDPGAGQRDFYTVALHEVGHLVGLDDLYNLTDLGEFPNSLMGIGSAGIMRDIDFGSIQGGVDLYSIPIPEPSTLLLLGSGLVGIIGFGRKKLFKKA